MPGSIVVEFLLQTVGEFVLHGLFYFTGRAVVPVLTFGRVTVEPLRAPPGDEPKKRHVRRVADGTIVLSADAATAVGFFVWFVATASVVAWYWSGGPGTCGDRSPGS